MTDVGEECNTITHAKRGDYWRGARVQNREIKNENPHKTVTKTVTN